MANIQDKTTMQLLMRYFTIDDAFNLRATTRSWYSFLESQKMFWYQTITRMLYPERPIGCKVCLEHEEEVVLFSRKDGTNVILPLASCLDAGSSGEPLDVGWKNHSDGGLWDAEATEIYCTAHHFHRNIDEQQFRDSWRRFRYFKQKYPYHKCTKPDCMTKKVKFVECECSPQFDFKRDYMREYIKLKYLEKLNQVNEVSSKACNYSLLMVRVFMCHCGTFIATARFFLRSWTST